MPKGHSKLEEDVKTLNQAILAAIERIADLERRLEAANNDYLARGYVPPRI